MPVLSGLYDSCKLCPRTCGFDRSERRGFCGEGTEVRVASACLHKGEEPPLSDGAGSGAVFFTGCTLKCASCQNYQISSAGMGTEVSTETLAEIFLALQRRGAMNINLVTGTHFAPSILEALAAAREKGLAIPAVWNSSGLESLETLALLHQSIDIYLPDLKTLDEETAFTLFGRRDYPGIARAALLSMADAKPLVFEGDRLLQGMIVRHLVLPGRLDSTCACLAWFREHLYGRAYLSLMFQYLPLERGVRLPAGARQKISDEEYRSVLEFVDELEIEEGFIQELETAEDWLPDFRRINPFPEGFAKPVWHPSSGFIS